MTKKLLLLITFVVLSLVFCNICIAADTTTIGATDTTTIGATEPTQFHIGDWFISETDLVIDEKVDGNVFAIGNSVTINSEISGDLFVISNNLTISENAKIGGNVFAIASNLSTSGLITGDVYSLSQTTTLNEKSNIGRSMNCISGDFYIDGIINRNLNLYVENFPIPNTSKLLIKGDFNYRSVNEINLAESNVQGNTLYTPIVRIDNQKIQIKDYISSLIRALFFTLIVCLLTFKFAPEFIDKASVMVSKKPIPVFFSGLGVLILTPIIILVLMFISITTAIAFILLFLYIIAIILAFTVLCMAIGKALATAFKQEKKSYVILFSLLATLVLWLLKLIPAIGGYISAFILIIGLGLLIYNLFNKKALVSEEVKE